MGCLRIVQLASLQGLYSGGEGGVGYKSGLYWDNGKENGNYYLGFRV